MEPVISCTCWPGLRSAIQLHPEEGSCLAADTPFRCPSTCGALLTATGRPGSLNRMDDVRPCSTWLSQLRGCLMVLTLKH